MLLRRMLLIYLFVIVIPFLLVSSMALSNISKTVEGQVLQSNKVVLDNGVKAFSNFINDMKNITLDVAINNEIQNALRQFALDNNKFTENIDNLIMKNDYILQSLRKNNATINILPMDELGNVYFFDEESQHYVSFIEDEKNEWINETLSRNGSVLLTSIQKEDKHVIRLASMVTEMQSWDKTLGIITLDVNLNAINALLYDIKFGNKMAPYLVDSHGNILLPHLDPLNLDREITTGLSNSSFITENDRIIIRRIIGDTQWKIIGVIPRDEIIKKSNDIRDMFFIAGIVIIALMILASCYFSYSILNPIIRLTKQMKNVETGNLKEIDSRIYYKDEIATLYSQFNYMIRRINYLIDEVYLRKINEKESELKALQAQINPHFLYNTLDLINWMAIKYNAEDIRYVISSLAKMMRFSLNNGENLLTVRDELNQVKSYIEIQEMRYREKFQTRLEIDDNILDYTIIKLLLQPLVENAIIHGFNESDEKGELIIKGFIKGQDLVIEVINNGKMIEFEKIRKLLDPSRQEKAKNYGIRNVNARLIKQYGQNYGLIYECENDLIKAIIRIPMEKLGREGEPWKN